MCASDGGPLFQLFRARRPRIDEPARIRACLAAAAALSIYASRMPKDDYVYQGARVQAHGCGVSDPTTTTTSTTIRFCLGGETWGAWRPNAGRGWELVGDKGLR